MRVVCGIACIYVAVHSAARAVGAEDQTIFADSTVWVWWLPAAFWFISAIVVLLRGAE